MTTSADIKVCRQEWSYYSALVAGSHVVARIDADIKDNESFAFVSMTINWLPIVEPICSIYLFGILWSTSIKSLPTGSNPHLGDGRLSRWETLHAGKTLGEC